MTQSVTKLVVLAAGLGTRMRRGAGTSPLSDEERRVAQSGVKALIPIGRPFLDHVLSRAADAGVTRVCLVIGPRHDELRRYYSEVECERLKIEFAVQQEPLGTAHALAAAASFVGDDSTLVLNSDNCYPSEALRQLVQLAESGVVGFDRDALIAGGTIAVERISQFSILESDEAGYLRRITEKPDQAQLRQLRPPVLVGMNCWRFPPAILQSCARIVPSPRGEFELPDAVNHSMHAWSVRYRVLASPGPVLDLSHTQDIAHVKRHLQGEDVRL